MIILTACTTDNETPSTTVVPDFPKDEDWKEELMDGASITVKRFEAGDEVTRASIYYDGQGLVFGMEKGDRIGLFPTAMDYTKASEDQKSSLLDNSQYPHPTGGNMRRVNPEMSNESYFWCGESTGQVTRISKGDAEFPWDDVVKWSACFTPSRVASPDETYENVCFTFENQTQRALTEVGEYFDYEDATDADEKNEHLNKYLWSEKKACEHLGNFDATISPETAWEEGVRIRFQMRHVGAIARIYLRSVEENLVIKDIKLICDKKIFYEKGSFNLISHPYSSTATNYGVDLDRNSAKCQIQPVGDPVNMLQLNFTSDCVTKKSGNNWGPYIAAYLMMYPITYNPTNDGNLFAYVTAYRQGDDPSKEVHFVSQPLSKKTMKSGNYYQWTSNIHPDDGLYPIELTATLLPWQDIVGGNINADLTK
ncbi:MAG: hypothetical protein KBT34_14675 [Prevotella sp.]|nr:hypothetical protein [Candidatus Prevotella equi]